MTAQEFDRRFDEGEDITPYIDDSALPKNLWVKMKCIEGVWEVPSLPLIVAVR